MRTGKPPAAPAALFARLCGCEASIFVEFIVRIAAERPAQIRTLLFREVVRIAAELAAELAKVCAHLAELFAQLASLAP